MKSSLVSRLTGKCTVYGGNGSKAIHSADRVTPDTTVDTRITADARPTNMPCCWAMTNASACRQGGKNRERRSPERVEVANTGQPPCDKRMKNELDQRQPADLDRFASAKRRCQRARGEKQADGEQRARTGRGTD